MPMQEFPSLSRGATVAVRLIQLALLIAQLTLPSAAASSPSARTLNAIPPRPVREFRGAWIATVANLDWPSKPGLSTADQKAELNTIYDRAVRLHLNVLVLQVRTGCDALYASRLEPWSEVLTGRIGQAPEPYYDPLVFAVEEAHRRGLELHAWFNPFRIRAPNPKNDVPTNHVTRTHPEWIRHYGAQIWLDPGLKPVREYVTSVMLDVVKHYDVDGVHLDDYFYPYPEKNAAGEILDFPDHSSWESYVGSGGRLVRADWRRRNIDGFVEGLYRRIKAEKPWVKLGISPFGIWRLGFPPQLKKGLDAYEYLYADSRKWLSNGWVDYFAPQLYWPTAGGDQSYAALLDWWAGQNPKRRLLCPGNDLTKVGAGWSSIEIIKQVRLTRKQPRASGNMLWGISSLTHLPNSLFDAIAQQLYSSPALVPAFSWLTDSGTFAKPKLHLKQESGGKFQAQWSIPPGRDVWLWLFQTRRNGKWTAEILTGARSSSALPARSSTVFPDLLAITAIDRCGVASPTLVLETKQALGRGAGSAERTQLSNGGPGRAPLRASNR